MTTPRIVDGPEITGQVVHKQTGQAYGPVTVTVSPKVYTDREMTASVTSLTTDGTGVFSCYAPPGTYAFTTTAVDAQAIESVEVLGREGGTGVANAASGTSTVITASGDTTGATDTAAINTAITTVSTAGGGIIDLIGTFWTNAPIVWKSGVVLRGQHWRKTVVNLASGANCDMVTADSALYFGGIRDLVFDGWKENQTAGYGINLNGLTAMPPRPTTPGGNGLFIERVLIRFCKQTGLIVGDTGSGAVELRLTSVYSWANDANGFKLNGSDIFATDCTAGDNVSSGFWVPGQGIRLANCKSWVSGFVSMNRANTTGFPTVGSGANGYDISGGNVTLISCEAQDSAGSGLNVGGDCINVYGFNADSNHISAYAIANARHCKIHGIIGNGSSHGDRSTSYALAVNDTACVGNEVRISWPNNTGGVGLGVSASNIPRAVTNDIVIGTPDAQLPTVWQATVTPDPFYGSPFFTLAGNVTVANPAADRYVPGMKFRVTVVQDATGSRTVTWGADYAVLTAVSATASLATTWTFECMNGKWVEVSSKAGLTGVTVPSVAPSQVGTVTATPGNTQVGLSWSAPANGGSAITDYVIQYRTTTGPGAWQTFADGTSTATTATVTGLTNGTSYDFQVAAVNAIGQGAYSAAVTSTPILLTTFISDTFVRANSTTSLGSPATGGAWTVDAGTTYGINGNQAYNPAADFGRVVSDGGASATGTAGITVRWTVSTNPGSVVICYLDTNNYIQISPIHPQLLVAGSGTAGGVADWSASVAGDVMKAVIDNGGARLTIYRNGTQIGQTSHANVATLAPNHKHGLMGVGSATTRWGDGTANADNFSVKNA